MYSNEDLVVLYRCSREERYLQELILKNKGLLHILTSSYVYSIPNIEQEDIISESYIPMLRAIEDFDISKGIAFSTFLKTYVKQHLNRVYTNATRKKRYTGSTAVSWEELIEIHKETSIETDYLECIEIAEFLGSLDGKLKSIAIYLYKGYSKSEISKLLGITPATTSYYIKKLRNFTTKYYAV